MGVAMILLASFVTTLTAISMSTICTNGEMKGGGLYYLISRTLGAEYGGSIGLIFSLANCVGGALHIVGFAETVNHLLNEEGVQMIDGDIWDIRVISVVTCTVLMTVIVLSPMLESKLQQVLLVPLVLAILNFVIGSFISTKDKVLHGYTGYQWETLVANWWPDFRDGHTFFTVFAVYFPAATGIMAGANISGNLKNPQIKKITIALRLRSRVERYLRLAVSTMIYTTFGLVAGATYVRDADGIINVKSVDVPECYSNDTCPFGLHNFYQAVCEDRLIPAITFFGKGYGAGHDPRRAYALCFIITIAVLMIGNLNVIAPFISNFFLCAYALVNYACFEAILSQESRFPPSVWLSLTVVITAWSSAVHFDHVHYVVANNTTHFRILRSSLRFYKAFKTR
ncbi:amino acid permease [Cooperia oncophora]